MWYISISLYIQKSRKILKTNFLNLQPCSTQETNQNFKISAYYQKKSLSRTQKRPNIIYVLLKTKLWKNYEKKLAESKKWSKIHWKHIEENASTNIRINLWTGLKTRAYISNCLYIMWMNKRYHTHGPTIRVSNYKFLTLTDSNQSQKVF